MIHREQRKEEARQTRRQGGSSFARLVECGAGLCFVFHISRFEFGNQKEATAMQQRNETSGSFRQLCAREQFSCRPRPRGCVARLASCALARARSLAASGASERQTDAGRVLTGTSRPRPKNEERVCTGFNNGTQTQRTQSRRSLRKTGMPSHRPTGCDSGVHRVDRQQIRIKW